MYFTIKKKNPNLFIRALKKKKKSFGQRMRKKKKTSPVRLATYHRALTTQTSCIAGG